MNAYRKKPVVVEAVQFTEALRDAIVLDGAECPAGVKRGATTWHQKARKVWSAHFFIETLEGRMDVSLGDWIITGVNGEHYPCKPDIFAATYEPALDEARAALAEPVADEPVAWRYRYSTKGRWQYADGPANDPAVIEEPLYTHPAAVNQELRKALDGLAFAAHQAGAEGKALGDVEEVQEWIDAAIARAKGW